MLHTLDEGPERGSARGPRILVDQGCCEWVLSVDEAVALRDQPTRALCVAGDNLLPAAPVERTAP